MGDNSAEGRRDPAVLRALLDRVQAAKGPDRSLDHAIGGIDSKILVICPNYASSLDASTALAERLLPGWRWKCGILEDGVCWCALYAKHHEPAEMDWAKTVPLAVLGALLKSLIANAVVQARG